MLVALLSAFLGGLILNVMPCVFPVLSLKAAGLVRHGGDVARVRLEGIAFFAGVMVTLLGLAGVLIAARAGGRRSAGASSSSRRRRSRSSFW